MNYTLSPKALADLDAIWDYTADRWGEDQADRYIRLIGRAFGDLANGSLPGRKADDIRAGYMKHLAGSHMIFYRRPSKENIFIVRILHKRMDISRHF